MLTRLLYRIGIAAITFGIGLGATSVLNRNRVISLCEVEAHPEKFVGKLIRFRALVAREAIRLEDGSLSVMDGRTDFNLAGSVCGEDDLAFASVDFVAGDRVGSVIPVVERMRHQEADRHVWTDALLVGELDRDIGPGCYTPKFHVRNTRVERIYSVIDFKSSAEAIDWFKSNPR